MAKPPSLKAEISKVLACAPSERARNIIDSPYTRQILEQLPPQEAFLVIKESWGMDSQILLQYVPLEAVCRFIDLDCWSQDALSVDSLMEWLWELYNASLDSLTGAFETLDMELLVLLFQTYIEVVHVRPTDEHIPELLDEGFESLDNSYFYRITREDERSHFIREMLSIAFTHDQDLYQSIMEGVLYDLKTAMEETSYERRSLRLMEMGFPSPEEAVSVYRHAVPGKLLNQGMIREKTPVITKHLHMLPSVYLDQFSPGQSLLLQALHGAPEEMRERLCYEMIYLANKIVMADYKPLNDSDGLRTSMEKASSLVNLGLGVAMREKGAQARDILASMNAETLFSLGFNMVLEQQRRLKLLLQDIERSMIPERFRDLTDGLLQKRPRYKDAEFSLVEELDKVTHASDQLEDMAAIMARLDWERLIPELGGTNTGSGMDMETVILTALAVNSLSRVTAFRPLSRDELVSFLSSATRLKGSRRTLQDAFRKDLPAFLSGIGQAGVPGRSASLAQNLAARLEEETGGIRDLSRIDPRFITCLCVRL